MQNRYLRLTLLLSALMILSSTPAMQAQEHFIKMAPFGLLDPLNPKLHMGFERVSENDLGLEIDLARFLTYDLGTRQDNKRGWLGAVEIRKYGPYLPRIKRFLRLSKFRKRNFFGAELQYIYRKYTALNDFDAFSNDFVDVPVTRKYTRLLFKMGEQVLYPSGFSYEIFAGLGLAQIREIHGAGDGIVGEDEIFSFSSTEAGGRVNLHFEFGVRISLAIKSIDVFSEE